VSKLSHPDGVPSGGGGGGGGFAPSLLFLSFVGSNKGASVFVAVAVGVGVNVVVAVAVGVCVGVIVGVKVLIGVKVFVTVGVGVLKKPPKLLSIARYANKASNRRISIIVIMVFGFILYSFHMSLRGLVVE
jgi:hypothetical protein